MSIEYRQSPSGFRAYKNHHFRRRPVRSRNVSAARNSRVLLSLAISQFSYLLQVNKPALLGKDKLHLSAIRPFVERRASFRKREMSCKHAKHFSFSLFFFNIVRVFALNIGNSRFPSEFPGVFFFQFIFARFRRVRSFFPALPLNAIPLGAVRFLISMCHSERSRSVGYPCGDKLRQRE